ncbi:MAG: universal stress protein [Alphaproteobacteria bacterium]
MSIASVLVHVGNDARTTERLEAATALARNHQAHLSGLYVLPDLELPAVAYAYVGSEIIEQQREIAKQDAAEAEAAFRVRADGEALHNDWRCEDGDLYDVITRLARYADVVVLGQTPPDNAAGRIFIELPEQVLLAAGRPVLIVPYTGSYLGIGERVLVAWDGSREATRAVHDALPVLAKARKVTVLSINPQKLHDVSSVDMAAHLARHGVAVEASETASDDVGTGDVLLSRAADLGADLIVMGAYGHSRAREWVVGGVTRHVLSHMTMPVLMSH